MKRVWKNQNGMIMIESLIVFIFTVFLLMMVIGMLTMLYQRWNIQSVATDAATKLAQTYQYSETLSQAKMTSGQISASDALLLRPYRYIFHRASFEDDARQRAVIYAEERLDNLMFYIVGSDSSVTASIESDFLARRHVEVRISSKFTVPFQSVLDGFGLGNGFEYSVTGYADCIDMLDYLTTVDFVDHVTDPNYWFKSKTVNAINSMLKLISMFVN